MNTYRKFAHNSFIFSTYKEGGGGQGCRSALSLGGQPALKNGCGLYLQPAGKNSSGLYLQPALNK